MSRHIKLTQKIDQFTVFESFPLLLVEVPTNYTKIRNYQKYSRWVGGWDIEWWANDKVQNGVRA